LSVYYREDGSLVEDKKKEEYEEVKIDDDLPF
jgi:hypothetical protein